MAGSIYIISAILLWSSLGVLVKLAGVPVHVLIFYSTLVSLLIQGVILSKKEYREDLFPVKRLLPLVILGPLTLLNIWSFFYAFRLTTIANAIMAHYVAPVVVAFLAPVFLKEALTRKVVFSIIVASVGLWILLDVPMESFLVSLGSPDSDTAGILAGLFSGFSYGLLIIATRFLAVNNNPLVMCFIQNIVMCVILLPFITEFPLSSIWVFVLMGTVHSTIAPVLYFRGMRDVAANRAAVLGYIEPFSAIMFAMVFLDEYPTMVSLSGGVLIILAGYIVIRNGKHREQ